MVDRADVLSDEDYARARRRVEQLAGSASSAVRAAELAALLRAMRAWERLRDRADAIADRPPGSRLQ